MEKFKKLNFAVLLLLTIVLLSACADKNNQDTTLNQDAETETLTEAEDAEEIASAQGIESLEPVLTLDNAFDLFYNTFEKETVNFELIKLEKDHSKSYHYFIEGWDDQYNYQLKIDVGTGEIVEQEMKVSVQTGDTLDLDAAIKPKEAMAVALEGFDNEAVEGWELRVDQTNRMIYEIIFLSGNNQMVDALAGKII